MNERKAGEGSSGRKLFRDETRRGRVERRSAAGSAAMPWRRVASWRGDE